MNRDWLLQFFNYNHLPQHLAEISRPFAELAMFVEALPDNPERTMALRKLLEAKDCAVRAALAGDTTSAPAYPVPVQLCQHPPGAITTGGLCNLCGTTPEVVSVPTPFFQG